MSALKVIVSEINEAAEGVRHFYLGECRRRRDAELLGRQPCSGVHAYYRADLSQCVFAVE